MTNSLFLSFLGSVWALMPSVLFSAATPATQKGANGRHVTFYVLYSWMKFAASYVDNPDFLSKVFVVLPQICMEFGVKILRAAVHK